VPVSKPRFGVDMTRIPLLDPSVARSFLAVVAWIKGAGFAVESIRLPDRDTVTRVHGVLTLAQARSCYAGLWPMTVADLGQPAYQALSIAFGLDQAGIDSAEESAAVIVDECARMFRSIDVILAPTLPVRPPPAGARSVLLNGRKVPTISALVAETCLANTTGGPALVLPLAVGNEMQAVSVQLLGSPDTDAGLFRHGSQLEEIVVARARGAGVRLRPSRLHPPT
jgi:Asp-tRNA(Asn)/Glu-tRNA(Gln) amidotransferase A subunit family amidase